MISELDVVSCFKKIIEKRKKVRSHLLEEWNGDSLWISEEHNNLTCDIYLFTNALLDIYRNQQRSPQHTSSWQGALGGSAITLQTIKELNQAKSLFKDTVRGYLKVAKQRETTIIHELLFNAGFKPVKLMQVYRQIPIVDYHPRRISFTLVRHNSQKKITKGQAIEKLIKAGQGSHIDNQLDKLNRQGNDINLIVHREISQLWAANIGTFKDENNRSSTTKIMTSLPIIYLHQPTLPQPLVSYSEKRTSRKPRADKKIEKEVFLKSIRTYRYKVQD